jgi:hypothetical protein
MLKVTYLALACSAALGMSIASATTIPSNAPVIGGFTSTLTGNTLKVDYTSQPTADTARLMRGTYNPATNQSGFQALMKGKAYIPASSRQHDYEASIPIPKAPLAKAIAKTLPIVGNAIAMKELLDELFGKPHSWDGDEWRRTSFTESEFSTLGNNVAFQNLPSPSGVTGSNWTSCGTHWANAALGGHYVSINTKYTVAVKKVSPFSVPSGMTIALQCWSSGIEYRIYNGPIRDKTYTTADPTVAVTEPMLESGLGSTGPLPAKVDPLIDDIPSAALKELAESTDVSDPSVSVIPWFDGQPSFEPYSMPPVVSTESSQSSQEVITSTKTTTTKVAPIQDGIRYDTTTTTTTQTQTIDPATGLPRTDPVTGEPITETTTTTETSEQTPNKPNVGEDLECGLPGTPPCKIDESGTPPPGDANFDAAEAEIEVFKSGLYEALQAKLNEIVHEWTWTFQLPTGCASLQFDTKVGPVVEIDMCHWQPMIHDIMSMLWAAAGVWGALMIFLRANG